MKPHDTNLRDIINLIPEQAFSGGEMLNTYHKFLADKYTLIEFANSIQDNGDCKSAFTECLIEVYGNKPDSWRNATKWIELAESLLSLAGITCLSTKAIYSKIMESEVFRLNGPSINLSESLIELGNAIADEEETNWNLGEHTEAPLSELVVGAYWSLAEWHGGQDSEAYAALSTLGRIYTPNMASAPDENDSAFDAHSLINAHFEKGGR